MPIGDDVPEAREQAGRFGLFAGEQRNLLRILPRPHEVVAKIGLIALLVEIEGDQRPTDEMRERGAGMHKSALPIRDIPGSRISPNRRSGAAAESPQRITMKDAIVTTALSSPTPMLSAFSINSLISSAMRWSGLSAASPSSCMR